MAPTLTWRHAGADGGDLIVAVGTWGIPHPTGYPTFVLIGRLFTLLPLGDMAYRINLMSALLGASAVALIFLTILCLQSYLERQEVTANTPSLIAAGVASVSLAFAPIFWSQALIAEVYVPTAFFAALLLFLVVFWSRVAIHTNPHPSPWWMGGIGLTLGAGLGLHPTLVFLTPLVLYPLVRQRGAITPKGAMLGIAMFLIGLSVYVYLPLRAMFNPPVNWGGPSGLEGFLWQVTGAPYRQNVLGVPLQFIPGRVLGWAGLMLQQFNALGIILGLVGWSYLWNRDKGIFVAGLISFLLFAAYSITYNTSDSYVYLIPSLMIYSLAIGAGIYVIWMRYILPWLLQGRTTWQLGINVGLAAIFLALLLPGFSLYRNFPEMDISRDRSALSYGERAFSSAAPDSIILADTDPHIFALWYYRYVVQPQSTVKVVAKPLLQYSWYRAHLSRTMREAVPDALPDDYSLAVLALLRYNLAKREVYLTRDDDALLTGFELVRKEPLFLLKAPSSP